VQSSQENIVQFDYPYLDDLATRIRALPDTHQRRLIAIAGPPASGKSVLSSALCEHLNTGKECATIVPLDGFHLDNRLLSSRGWLARKGAPETFDAQGFIQLVSRLKREPEIVFPIFDRSADISIAGAGVVGSNCSYVIVEGNYLLFDEDPWKKLAGEWDLSVFVEVPEEELRHRLISRWRDLGLSVADAEARCDENDLPNATRVMRSLLEPQLKV
jgi:fructokinase